MVIWFIVFGAITKFYGILHVRFLLLSFHYRFQNQKQLMLSHLRKMQQVGQ